MNGEQARDQEEELQEDFETNEHACSDERFS